MSTQSLTDSSTTNAAARFAETLKFITSEQENVRAFDALQALIGVCQAMDRHPVEPFDDYDTHILGSRLATAARLLAEQLEARVEFDHAPRRRIR